MANYNKSLIQTKWLTQDPQPKPVLLLVAAMLILITKPYWNIISFDHDFVATEKQKLRVAAFAILLAGLYVSCNIDGWINWKHSAFSRSPSTASCCHRATSQWRLDMIVRVLCGMVGFVVLVLVGEHQSDVHGRWFSVK